MEQAKAALAKLKDPETGEPIFTKFFDAATGGPIYGISGPTGADLYFDLAPGYQISTALSGPIAEQVTPSGSHGLPPDRDDMKAILVAVRPGIGSELPQRRTIDVRCSGLGRPAAWDLVAIAPDHRA